LEPKKDRPISRPEGGEICGEVAGDGWCRRHEPERILTNHQPLTDVLDAYRNFDEREAGGLKLNFVGSVATNLGIPLRGRRPVTIEYTEFRIRALFLKTRKVKEEWR
jgi:hypothetical protein